MIRRDEFMAQLYKWKDDDVIKAVTGVRRCGKSTLLRMFADELAESGTDPARVIYINFEDFKYRGIRDSDALYDYVADRLRPGGKNYVFLDEVQRVRGFEEAVDGLYVRGDADVYMTGSNAYLLSGELATYLSGRYVEMRMLPFSFREFSAVRQGRSADDAFGEYLSCGGFPAVAGEEDEGKRDMYLDALFNTVVLKDIVSRSGGDANGRINMTLLLSVSRYLSSTAGSPVSVNGMADYLRSNRIDGSGSAHTVEAYVDGLVNAFVFYPAERTDMHGKEIFKTNRKYYAVDTGLRNFLLGGGTPDTGFAIENVVYLELLRRGYRVSTGRRGDTEIDFVARRNGGVEYFQVTESLLDPAVRERETRSLRATGDDYPKTVLTAERVTCGNDRGIAVRNVADWLLQGG